LNETWSVSARVRVSLPRGGALSPRSRARRRFLGSRMVASCPARDTLHRTALLRRVRRARRELEGYLQAANLGMGRPMCQSSSFDNTRTLSSRTAVCRSPPSSMMRARDWVLSSQRVPIRMSRSSLVTASDGLEGRCHLGGQHVRSRTFIRVFPCHRLRRPPSNEVRPRDTVPAQGMVGLRSFTALDLGSALAEMGLGFAGAPRPPASDSPSTSMNTSACGHAA
jgi:hypothetical protein